MKVSIGTVVIAILFILACLYLLQIKGTSNGDPNCSQDFNGCVR